MAASKAGLIVLGRIIFGVLTKKLNQQQLFIICADDQIPLLLANA